MAYTQKKKEECPIKTVNSFLSGLFTVTRTLSVERQVHVEFCNLDEPTLFTVNSSIHLSCMRVSFY